MALSRLDSIGVAHLTENGTVPSVSGQSGRAALFGAAGCFLYRSPDPNLAAYRITGGVAERQTLAWGASVSTGTFKLNGQTIDPTLAWDEASLAVVVNAARYRILVDDYLECERSAGHAGHHG
jgi:hypothetical protein